VIATVVGAAAHLAPAFAETQREAPDTETLNRLQARFEGGRRARIVVSGGERIMISPVFTLMGVRGSESASDLALTPWSEIEHVDARGGRPKTGALIGGIVGLGFGVAIGFVSAMSNDSQNGLRDVMGATVVFTAAGAIGGAVVGGAALHGGWTQVYPETRSGSAWGLEKK
jgi:hypothetical protein